MTATSAKQMGLAVTTLVIAAIAWHLARLHLLSPSPSPSLSPSPHQNSREREGEREEETATARVQLPSEDYADYRWIDPTPQSAGDHNCGNCHEEIYRQWRGGAHAQSARNRRFLEIYGGPEQSSPSHDDWNLLANYPEGRAVCASCHVPALEFRDPGTHDLRLTTGVAAEGIHCDFCHKVQDVSTENVGLAHGRFGMQLVRPREGQVFFGPLKDAARAEDVYASVYQVSRYCSACHEGTLFGVHVYSTYSEWLASPAAARGKHCQSCHMAADGKMTNVAPGHGGLARDPVTLASHELFPGGKEAMLRRAIKVAAEVEPAGEGVRCVIDVLATEVGHRVPTGFIDRHLILVLEAFDGRGRLLPAASGPLLPEAAGDLAGRPGRLFARLLTDDQKQGPIPFWRATADPLDTRLEPERSVRTEVNFGARPSKLRVRLLYRRFWHETSTVKGWPDETTTLFDRMIAL